ncbi:MAG TPA: CDP-alcohol phosphatidyltransferase family protein [Geminicoccaceae bacterium]|nr:CDP-alcohol phosphatidyltransferase family protein [Geminicoccaceae bacterium]
MLDRFARPLIDPPLDRLAARLAPRVAADEVTLVGFALGLVAMALIMLGLHLPGLAFLLLNRLADGLDGAIARRNGITDLGGYLDITLDLIVYSGLVFAMAVADPAANALAAAFLVFSFMGTGASFLAFAIMAARRGLESRERGTKSLYFLGGLAEGTETILFFVLALLWPAAFAGLAWAFGLVCWVTTASRILMARQLLGDRPAGG